MKPRRIIVVNTEESYWNEEGYKGIRGLEVHHVTKAEFDHGGTRNLAAWYSEAEIMIFMTQDAVPQDEYLIENLLKGLDQNRPDRMVRLSPRRMRDSFRRRIAI